MFRQCQSDPNTSTSRCQVSRYDLYYHCPALTRIYELKRRAENQEETRRRIVEAANELHKTIGPAATKVTPPTR